ncbi:MAG: neutral/alkaline non-lysosomal ceramidase N-terminal domain-containing protein [Planctomycetaceae bacterium]
MGVRLLMVLAVGVFATSARGDGAGDGEEPRAFSVGVAAEDITPLYPIRLNGFGGRSKESEGVRQAIQAKALVVAAETPENSDHQNTVIVITVDTLGIPDDLHERVAAGIAKATGVPRKAVAICASHTHSAPMIVNCANTLFGNSIPDDQWQRIQKYTSELEASLVKVAMTAFQNKKPSRLSWGQGQVTFAQNRRTAGGPVDHDLPVLAVHDLEGTLRAVFTNYACHCVTLSDDMISGDWAGYAMEHIQRMNPGCEALISIGCGADSNPRGGVLGSKADAAEALGIELAQEVDRVLSTGLQPITQPPVSASHRIVLPLAPLPSREDWQKKAELKNAIGYHARVQLERLDRGEPLLSEISYPVQSFSFGTELSWLFLPGEVVVDYSLRLKQELNGERLWIHAYSNACPGYVPSERILKEGGYEGGGAMVYYDIPGPYATGLEQKIVDAARQQLDAHVPATAQADPARTNGIRPLSPRRALSSLRTSPGMHAELVTSEPNVESPVAIAFGPSGELWVAEMWDYPQGDPAKSKGQASIADDLSNAAPGISGRVRCLRDREGDGSYESSTVFLEGIPFPTGVTPWRDGVLVCAAPDILFAKDADGDGKAEIVETLFTGFATHNFQARVNSLEYGLDGWLYGSCGLFGGQITSTKTGEVIALGQRDFRCNPDTGAFEPATGSTQQGRVRNDWGDWFGCNNSQMLLHYPLNDRYLRRNPLVAPERTVVPIVAEPGRLFSLSSQVLFALSGPPNHPTAACGLGIYRDDLLGNSFSGNAFTCEPVNNLVHRQILTSHGATFQGRRSEDEQDRDFLASTDPWFRPVQMRTGTDGALWVVDMYRYVIEHPIWIPPDTLSRLDTRAGADMGRLYRIVPDGKPLRKMPDLATLTGEPLANAMRTSNGTQRDLVQQQILWKQDRTTIETLTSICQQDERPEVRVQALATLACLKAVSHEVITACLRDSHPQVRRTAIACSELLTTPSETLTKALATLAHDSATAVRQQLLYTAGELPAEDSAQVLQACLEESFADGFMKAAFESSLNANNVALLASRADVATQEQLTSWIAALSSPGEMLHVFKKIADKTAMEPTPNHLQQLEQFVRGWRKRTDAQTERLTSIDGSLSGTVVTLQRLASEETEDADKRMMAVRLLGIFPSVQNSQQEASKTLLSLLSPRTPPNVQTAAVRALAMRSSGSSTAEQLLSDWPSRPPALRRAIIGILLERVEWTKVLLQHIQSGTLTVAELELTQQQQLLNHSEASIKALAEQCFHSTLKTNRSEVVTQYTDGLKDDGSPVQGREVFRKHCSNCHRLQDIGHAVGPDLANYAGKPASALIVAMMDPGQAVDPRYQAYIAVLTDGRALTGLITEETATSLTLLAPEGKRETILRTDLEELKSTGKSLMPEGFEKNASVEDVSHLWAWIRTQRSPAKELPGNRPMVVEVPSEANGVLPASQAEIFGGDITFEEPFQNVGYWHGRDDYVRWQLHSVKSREVMVWAEWSCDSSSAGNTFLIEGGRQKLQGKVAGTGGWDRYQLQRLGKWIIPEGNSEILVRPGAELRGALADLRALHLVVVGGVPLATGNVVKEAVHSEPQTDAEIAAAILDDRRTSSDREALVRTHVGKAAVLLPLMAKGLPEQAGSPEEYRRIPWIWRLAIAAAKTGDDAVIRAMLEAALPQNAEPLAHWQAVVIGGGIINGMTQTGRWPKSELATMIGEDRLLLQRWNRSLEDSVRMLEDDKVPAGTRYDALRMVAMLEWEKCRSPLEKYLNDSNSELQMGAVSGLGDVPESEAAKMLILSSDKLTGQNLKLTQAALLRTDERTLMWLRAIAAKEVQPPGDPEIRKAISESPNAEIRELAKSIWK